jgi:hypothetical protein
MCHIIYFTADLFQYDFRTGDKRTTSAVKWSDFCVVTILGVVMADISSIIVSDDLSFSHKLCLWSFLFFISPFLFKTYRNNKL